MARNKTLLSILQKYRSEIRASGNAAHNQGARENQVQLLQRTQEWLWEEHDWAHLKIRRSLPLQAGQRYFDTPDDMDIDRLESIEVRYGNDWLPLMNGIGPAQYSAWDSDLGIRSWPVERWQIYEDEQFEVWPIPESNANPDTLDGTLRLNGIRNLRPLVADNDRADLDDRLITLYAAAEHLGARGADDAAIKLQMAERRFQALVGNNSKMRRFSMLGSSGMETNKRLHGPPRVHYRDRETS